MYLTQLDKKTGLINIENIEDGVLSIKEFREIIQDKELGIMCFTAIALTADYLSPIRYYDDNDRPRKAQEEVTGDRDYWTWKSPKIQSALKKYDELQYDPTLEEGRIHMYQKTMKLKQITAYDALPLNHDDRIMTSMSTLKKELRAINADIDEYEKRISGKELYNESPVKNGYTLSRLEQKLENKRSFYHTVR